MGHSFLELPPVLISEILNHLMQESSTLFPVYVFFCGGFLQIAIDGRNSIMRDGGFLHLEKLLKHLPCHRKNHGESSTLREKLVARFF